MSEPVHKVMQDFDERSYTLCGQSIPRLLGYPKIPTCATCIQLLELKAATSTTKRTRGEWQKVDGSVFGTWETGEPVQICTMATTSWSRTGAESELAGFRNTRMREETNGNQDLIVRAPKLAEVLHAIADFWIEGNAPLSPYATIGDDSDAMIRDMVFAAVKGLPR